MSNGGSYHDHDRYDRVLRSVLLERVVDPLRVPSVGSGEGTEAPVVPSEVPAEAGREDGKEDLPAHSRTEARDSVPPLSGRQARDTARHQLDRFQLQVAAESGSRRHSRIRSEDEPLQSQSPVDFSTGDWGLTFSLR